MKAAETDNAGGLRQSRLPHWLRCFFMFLYRNTLVTIREPWALIFQLAVPILVGGILFWARQSFSINQVPETRYLTDPAWQHCPFGLYGPRASGPAQMEPYDMLCQRWGHMTQYSWNRLTSALGVGESTSRANGGGGTIPYSIAPFRQERTYDGLHMLTLLKGDRVLDNYRFAGIDNPGCKDLAAYLEDVLAYLLPWSDSPTAVGDVCPAAAPCEPSSALVQRVKLQRRDRRMQLVADNDPILRRPPSSDEISERPSVVFVCRSAVPDDIRVDIRFALPGGLLLALSSLYPIQTARAMPYDNKDLIPGVGLAPAYGASLLGFSSPSFLDYQSLVTGYALSNASAALRTLLYKPLPGSPFFAGQRPVNGPPPIAEEIELVRRYQRAFRAPDVGYWRAFESIVKAGVPAVCLICHKGYVLYQHRTPDVTCDGFRRLLALLYPSLAPDWETIISEPPEESWTQPGVQSYCSSTTLWMFAAKLLETTPAVVALPGDALAYALVTQALADWASLILNPAIRDKGLAVNFHESAWPTPAGNYDGFPELFVRDGTWAIALMVVFMFPLRSAVRIVMTDKELNMRELLKIFGAGDTVFWVSTYMFCLVWYGIISLILAIWMRIVLPGLSILAIFLLFLFFIPACVSFGILICAFFTRARTAVIVAVGCYFAMFQAYSVMEGGQALHSPAAKRGAMLLFPCAFSWGFQAILGNHLAAFGRDVPDMSMGHFTTPYMGISVADACGMLFLDTLLYLILGLYFHRLFPGDLGVPQPWYFPITAVAGILPPWRKKTEPATGKETAPMLSRAAGTARFEPPPTGRNVSVAIKDIRKRFVTRDALGRRTGTVDAVQGVTLDVYEGEIFALLGHNGAGKTTLINMLTGMLAPTSGTGTIMGYDIRTHLSEARSQLGFCPQGNVLLDTLTIREHLIFFGYIKGVATRDLSTEIDRMAELLNIHDKLRSFSKNLSGGQKRRLCVAIALIGGSRVVFLDEPSSGMDPYTRRTLWDILRGLKAAGRAIILTTHHMEEADILGDRVGIMGEGKLQCLGTSLFLKKRFGVGYTLTLTKRDDYTLDQEEKTMHLVTTSLPNASRLSNVALEMSFRVPFENVPLFPDLLGTLEAALGTYGIASFSLCVTTLEEVFLRMGASPDAHVETISEREDEKKRVARRRTSSLSFRDERTPPTPEEPPLETAAAPYRLVSRKSFMLADPEGKEAADVFSAAGNVQEKYKKSMTFRLRVLRTLLVKRAKVGVRDFRGLCCQVFVPVVLALLMLLSSLRIQKAFDLVRVDLIDAVNGYPYTTLTPQTLYYAAAPAAPSAPEFASLMDACGGGPHWTPTSISAESLEAFESSLINRTKEHPANSQYVAFYLDPTNQLHLVHDERFVHSIPYGLATLVNCALRGGASPASGDAPFRVVNNPLPRDLSFLQSVTQQLQALWAVIAFSIIVSTWGSTVLQERENRAKHAQHMAGVTVTEYWGSILIWDYVLYLFVFSVILIMMAAFRVPIVDVDHIGASLVTGLLFGLAVAPFIYLMTFIVRSPTGLQVVLMFLSFLCPIALIFLQLLESSAGPFYDWLQYLLFFIPHVAVAQAFLAMSWFWRPPGELHIAAIDVQETGVSIFDPRVTGVPLIYLGVALVLYGSLLLLVDAVATYPGRFQRRRRRPSAEPAIELVGSHESPSFYEAEDDDVHRERQTVESLVRTPQLSGRDIETGAPSRFPSILLYGLRRIFKARTCSCGAEARPIVAVRDLSFTVPSGQCFGFLGVNGAGKTTAMSMLTGVLRPTEGRAFLAGHDVFGESEKVWAKTGYCPQFDALFEHLTGAEHIYFYGRLAGLPERHLAAYTPAVLNTLGLLPYRDRMVKKYSGGNKRKLSVGLAFLRNPQVVFLDEPSTGVDPASRRKLWNIINETTMQSRRAVMLTTHSMEECEALCDRLAIMQGGRLLCIGTPSHLRSRFGQRYQLDVSLGQLEGRDEEDAVAAEVERFSTFLRSRCPNAECVETVGWHMRWVVPKDDQSLASLFRLIEQAKEELHVRDYAVSEASLESVFVRLQKESEKSKEALPSEAKASTVEGPP